MFRNKNGWLSYSPFDRYRLPEIVQVCKDGRDDKPASVPFVDRRTNKTLFERPLFRLEWPGELRDPDADVRIPLSVIRHWNVFSNLELEEAGMFPVDRDVVAATFKIPASNGPTLVESEDAADDLIEAIERRPADAVRTLHIAPDPGMPVARMVKEGRLPADLPEIVAWHLAVNRDVYAPMAKDGAAEWPVAGMPARVVWDVVDARFAFDKSAVPALTYLKWVAETHFPHPLLRGFDTSVREMLMEIGVEAVRLFFKLAFDYQYDPTSRWWARDDAKTDPRFAMYLHWVGKTRAGLYGAHSDLETPFTKDDAATLSTFGVRRRPVPDDVKKRMTEWDLWRSRTMSRDGGVDPAVIRARPTLPVVDGDSLQPAIKAKLKATGKKRRKDGKTTPAPTPIPKLFPDARLELVAETLRVVSVDPKALAFVPMEIARRHKCVPVQIMDGKLVVFRHGEFSTEATNDLKFVTGMDVEWRIPTWPGALADMDAAFAAAYPQLP